MRQTIKIPKRRKANLKNTHLVLNQQGWAIFSRLLPNHTLQRDTSKVRGELWSGWQGHKPAQLPKLRGGSSCQPPYARDSRNTAGGRRDGTTVFLRLCILPPSPSSHTFGDTACSRADWKTLGNFLNGRGRTANSRGGPVRWYPQRAQTDQSASYQAGNEPLRLALRL